MIFGGGREPFRSLAPLCKMKQTTGAARTWNGTAGEEGKQKKQNKKRNRREFLFPLLFALSKKNAIAASSNRQRTRPRRFSQISFSLFRIKGSFFNNQIDFGTRNASNPATSRALARDLKGKKQFHFFSTIELSVPPISIESFQLPDASPYAVLLVKSCSNRSQKI
mgnify:CR=1 FL=1|jgi:hypothetical protein